MDPAVAVVGRNLDGHNQEIDGTSSDKVNGLTKKAKFGDKGSRCRPLESQAMVHRDLSLHATPFQPTFHSIQKSGSLLVHRRSSTCRQHTATGGSAAGSSKTGSPRWWMLAKESARVHITELKMATESGSP